MSLEGCTALHFAASEGKSQAISNILRAGNVDVNAQAEVCSFCRNGAAQKRFCFSSSTPSLSLQSGTTALHWCAARGDTVSTNLLIQSKANVNIKDKVPQITT